jgi:hypothetical protein
MVAREDEDSLTRNYSDEELALLSFYPLMNAETDPGLRRQYQDVLTKVWERVRAEKNPLWDFIYAQGTGATDYDCADATDSLRRIPLSTISWTVKNSQRDDLKIMPNPDRFGAEQAQSAMVPNERSVDKWNSNPFELDGGNGGRSEDEGAFFLLPYWFGRYYHLIPCEH